MIVAALLLAFAWVALTGDASPGNLLAGLALALLLVRLGGPRAATSWRTLSLRGLRRAPQALALAAHFLVELVRANLRVTALVLRPRPALHPAILAVPIDLETDWQVTLLANLVTLTPGTLSIDVAPDRRTLFVHFLSVDDPEAARRELREGFERRVRSLRP